MSGGAGAGGGGGGGACSACLSAGRALRGLRALAPLYGALLQARDVCLSYEHVSVCWECAALLRRVAEFQRRARYAQRVLATGNANDNASGSTLKTSIKNTFDCTFVHDEDSDAEWNIPLGSCERIKVENVEKQETSDMSQNRAESLDREEFVDCGTEDIRCAGSLHNTVSMKRMRLDISPMARPKRNTEKLPKTRTKTRNKNELLLSKKLRKVKTNLDCNNIRKKRKAIVETRLKYDTFCVSHEEMLRNREICKGRAQYAKAAYKCDSCLLYFRSDEKLLEHNKLHEQVRQKLLEHNKLHEQHKTHSQCDICQGVFSRARMEAHRESHYVQYRCVECNYISIHEDVMQRHVRQAHRTSWKCRECEKEFPSLKKLTYHKEIAHTDPVKCDVCNREFKCKANLERHMLLHKGGIPQLPCPVCGKLYAGTPGLRMHMKYTHARGDEPYRCDECDIVFTTEYQLQVHLKNTIRHQGNKLLKHQCSECGKKFISETQLKAHVDYKHLGLFLFKCKICDKDLGSRDGLNKHVRSVHEGREAPRKCVCETCGQAFKANRELNQHRLIHTGERPFTCDVCGATFRQAPAMYTHKRLVHLKIKRTKKN